MSERAVPRIVLITDEGVPLTRTVAVVRAAAIAAGEDGLLVQLRDKEASAEDLMTSARVLRSTTTEVHARFVVNGSTSIALAVRADGVHFPKQDPSDLAHLVRAARGLLGASAIITTVAHADDDVRLASEAGATGVLVSPIFETPGKGSARGLAALTSARALVDAMRRVPSLLVYALGGIDQASAASCMEAGADGIAAIRALYDAPDVPFTFPASNAARSPGP